MAYVLAFYTNNASVYLIIMCANKVSSVYMSLFQEPYYSNNLYDNRKVVTIDSFIFSFGRK